MVEVDIAGHLFAPSVAVVPVDGPSVGCGVASPPCKPHPTPAPQAPLVVGGWEPGWLIPVQTESRSPIFQSIVIADGADTALYRSWVVLRDAERSLSAKVPQVNKVASIMAKSERKKVLGLLILSIAISPKSV